MESIERLYDIFYKSARSNLTKCAITDGIYCILSNLGDISFDFNNLIKLVDDFANKLNKISLIHKYDIVVIISFVLSIYIYILEVTSIYKSFIGLFKNSYQILYDE